MAITTLSLPVDIPWKRMGVTGDMIDTNPGDLKFPQRWRSSIAIFYHEPTELPPEYANRKITYLKVVCTITNFAPREDELYEVLDRLAEKYTRFITRHFSANVTKSYPCYGALLQVGVYPEPTDEVKPHDFPYISAFQPRKREMYETVTESGEIGSQSSNQVNVGKQMTNTESVEEYDLDLGSTKSRSGSGKLLWGLVGGSGASTKTENKQVGDITRTSDENQFVQSTDTSREKRESHSHSTTMNHIYSLLQGYHLGTNRAVFFMQPRPHIQNDKFSFIRGLRALEGVQEFFLIVNRPTSVPRLCVEVALETAHLFLERAYQPRLIPLSDLYVGGNLDKTAAALGLDLDDAQWTWWKQALNWNGYFPASRHAFHKLARGEYTDEQWAQIVEAVGYDMDDVFRMLQVIQKLPDIGAEDIALIFEEYETHLGGEFFISGRRMRSCAKKRPAISPDDLGPPDVGIEPNFPQPLIDTEESVEENISTYEEDTSSIVFEGRFPDITDATSTSVDGTTEARDLNQIVANIYKALQDSVTSIERAPYGEGSFLETDFMLNELAQFVRLLGKSGVEDKALSDISDIRYTLERGLGRFSGCRYATDLGTLTSDMIVRDLNVSRSEAKKIRKELLIAVLKKLDADTLNPESDPINPIREKFTARFPKDKLRTLEKSAGVIEGGPTRPFSRQQKL